MRHFPSAFLTISVRASWIVCDSSEHKSPTKGWLNASEGQRDTARRVATLWSVFESISDAWNITFKTSRHFQSVFAHQHNSITTVLVGGGADITKRHGGGECTALCWSPRGHSKRAALQSFSICRLMCLENSH